MNASMDMVSEKNGNAIGGMTLQQRVEAHLADMQAAEAARRILDEEKAEVEARPRPRSTAACAASCGERSGAGRRLQRLGGRRGGVAGVPGTARPGAGHPGGEEPRVVRKVTRRSRTRFAWNAAGPGVTPAPAPFLAMR